ncbi:MAG: hypothetical protein FJY56_16425 [Betaproteobacteria bacterium]|nr:hypothetical protein [Betaproteobacteria bacterium]
MKSLVAGCAIVLLLSGSAFAQMQEEKPRVADTAPRDIAIAIAIANPAKHAREADARHCLSLNSDRAVMRCAEPYRYRYGGARGR